MLETTKNLTEVMTLIEKAGLTSSPTTIMASIVMLLTELKLINEKIERYVDEKIESDKVLIGLLSVINTRQEIEFMENGIMTETNERPGSGISESSTDKFEEIFRIQDTLRILNETVGELSQRIRALESKAQAEKAD